MQKDVSGSIDFPHPANAKYCAPGLIGSKNVSGRRARL
jgi:hypothetical protein